MGDVCWPPGTNRFAEIEGAVDRLLASGTRVLALGGDHSITYPVVRAYARHWPELSILQLDAHPDLYDDFEGNRHSHACPFARVMEEGLAKCLLQVGVRTMNPHQREQARRFDVRVIEMRDWHPGASFEFDGPLYLSLDLDVLDPAFAPGVSHHEPGGMTTRDVLTIIQTLRGQLVGADIVEFNPQRDPVGVTAALGAKLVKEIVARLLASTTA